MWDWSKRKSLTTPKFGWARKFQHSRIYTVRRGFTKKLSSIGDIKTKIRYLSDTQVERKKCPGSSWKSEFKTRKINTVLQLNINHCTFKRELPRVLRFWVGAFRASSRAEWGREPSWICHLHCNRVVLLSSVLHFEVLSKIFKNYSVFLKSLKTEDCWRGGWRGDRRMGDGHWEGMRCGEHWVLFKTDDHRPVPHEYIIC